MRQLNSRRGERLCPAPKLPFSSLGGALGLPRQYKLGVEYLHYGFPEQTITFSNNAGGSFTFKAKEHVDAVKGRLSYLFSIH
jgi:hypothetical protein